MSFKNSENGHVLVVTALSLAVVMGFAGLALDVGLLYRSRQNLQIAADAAATAAAMNYLYTQSVSSAVTAGKAASSQNGFTDGSNDTSVTVNLPPSSGAVTSSGYAEAVVSKLNTTNFMVLLGFGKIKVSSRAVAGAPQTGGTCIWLPAATGTVLTLKGSDSINAGCGIYVNSDSSNAVDVHDSGVSVNATYLDVVGNESPKFEPSPTTITPNAAPRTNPWGNLSGPSTPSSCSITSAATSITTSNVATVQGSASNPVVCFTKAVTLGSNAGAIVLPGASAGVVYLFENGVTVNGTVTLGSGSCNVSTLTCNASNGAVMDLQNGSLTQSNGALNIYSPTSGNYNGIAILQPSSNTTELKAQFGSSNEVLDGYIYAPGAEIYLQDQGGGIIATGIVAGSIDGNSTIAIANASNFSSYDTANAPTTLNRVITLVE
jgi:hypothetical protein